MKKSGLFGVLLAVALLFTAVPSLAFAEDVGNKVCPVTGEAVNGQYFVEYEGKRYSLCCPMCAKKFNSDPEAFIAKLNSEKQA